MSHTAPVAPAARAAVRPAKRGPLPALDAFGTHPIVDAVTAGTWQAWANAGAVHDRAGELRLAVDSNLALTLCDLRLAQRRGQRCPKYTVRPADHQATGDGYSLTNLVTLHGSAAALRDALAALPWEASGPFAFYRALPWTFDGRAWEVSRSDAEAVRVFSPLHLDRFAPLPALPAKWTAAHVVRALVHGQLAGLTRAYALSDDYAGDAAANFGRGPAHALDLARRLCESPSGWWFRQEAGPDGAPRVSISCHQFESLDAAVDLDGRPAWGRPAAEPAGGAEGGAPLPQAA